MEWTTYCNAHYEGRRRQQLASCTLSHKYYLLIIIPDAAAILPRMLLHALAFRLHATVNCMAQYIITSVYVDFQPLSYHVLRMFKMSFKIGPVSGVRMTSAAWAKISFRKSHLHVLQFEEF